MAETDRFLLSMLAESGCLPEITAFERAKDTRLTMISGDMLLEIVWRCLENLNATTSMMMGTPSSNGFEAPHGVAAKHRMGSAFATTLKELGYAGECGYNHFLYPSEKETRNILAWLVGKLPRTMSTSNEERKHVKVGQDESGDETLAWIRADQMLEPGNLSQIFAGWKKKKTVPALPHRQLPQLCGFARLPLQTASIHLPWLRTEQQEGFQVKTRASLFANCRGATSKAVSVLEAMDIARRMHAVGLDVLEEELPEEDTLDTTKTIEDTESIPQPSENGKDVYQWPNEKGSNNEKFPQNYQEVNKAGIPILQFSLSLSSSSSALDDSEASELPQEEKLSPAERIHERLTEIQHHVEQIRSSMEHETAEVSAVEDRVKKAQLLSAELQKELTAHQQLASLLPQAEVNIAKLEGICTTSEGKLQELTQQWESLRAPLMEEAEALTAVKSTRKTRCRQLVAEIKALRTEVQTIATALQEKQAEMLALTKAHAALPQDSVNSRLTYTSRIMDIIKQVHKQKAEIRKVLEDIRILQKQLNASSEKLKRCEAITEDKLYSEVSRHIKPESSNSRSNAASPQDRAYLDCYRKFAQVRELFEELILVVTDGGKQENLARDLDNWITQLQSRDSLRHLEKVLRDVQCIRQENAALQAQLRAVCDGTQ